MHRPTKRPPGIDGRAAKRTSCRFANVWFPSSAPLKIRIKLFSIVDSEIQEIVFRSAIFDAARQYLSLCQSMF
jgi:hypothetical protein